MGIGFSKIQPEYNAQELTQEYLSKLLKQSIRLNDLERNLCNGNWDKNISKYLNNEHASWNTRITAAIALYFGCRKNGQNFIKAGNNLRLSTSILFLAAVVVGDAPLLKQLTPKQTLDETKTFHHALKYATIMQHFQLIKWLKCFATPEKFQQLLEKHQFSIFQEAIRTSRDDIITWFIMNCDSKKVFAMVKLHNFKAIELLLDTKHTACIQYLLGYPRLLTYFEDQLPSNLFVQKMLQKFIIMQSQRMRLYWIYTLHEKQAMQCLSTICYLINKNTPEDNATICTWLKIEIIAKMAAAYLVTDLIPRAMAVNNQNVLSHLLHNFPFKLNETLGRGGFGTVYRGSWQQQEVAIKAVVYNPFQEEFSIQKSLQHSNIIKVLDVFYTEHACFAICELMSHSLNDLLFNSSIALSWTQRFFIALQIAEAMVYLCKEYILHRDVKPSNILVHNQQVKLTDFGCAIRGSFYMNPREIKGTFAYIAPEIYKEGIYSTKSEVFAVGVTFWGLATRKKPYDSGSKSCHFPENVRNGFQEEIPQNIPETFRQLISQCAQQNTSNRPEINQIAHQLSQSYESSLGHSL
ncbi:MAG TPA: protein kinase [Legionellaceae bacterium]|nr:protein kinase [Legionellaceae bacterium]